ncbi:NHS-like protein 3 isoform X2 [Alosa pseudoharengus]|uniref:NHS-like protein 3 isoform X2 n=1 Tax=Alosa pseudoharengus TaxID=34774 RepID=UPI003F8C10E6
MGNAISKKRAQASPSLTPRAVKAKSFWPFGRAEKPQAAGPKDEELGRLTVHYTASPHFQENVFIEGSRPKHLQDLHTEAQEGLKILLQEEHKNGVDFQADQSNSEVEPWPERDAAGSSHREESEGPGSIAANSCTSSASAASATSSVSNRPLLTRQGSTFKPLHPVKRPERTKKRTRRTTIMGIPQQVQRELVMQRAALPQQQQVADDGVTSLDVVIIPTIDGETPAPDHEGVRVHLQSIDALQASREEQLLRQHLQALYRDDLALAHRTGPRASALQRPKSLAVPGLTSSSFLHEPLGPVMSISPQATYLSKIIPNAILPAAVDVIQIDRSRRNRGSMRAVSKSSLASASPPLSCRSGDDTQEPRSSASSHGSQSQSSETVVSNSSTVSSKGATLTPAECPKERGDLSMAHTSTRVALSSFCSESKGTSLRGPESRVTTVAEVVKDDDDDEDGENVRNSRAFTRSLSVMKTKQPPAPPRRTFSLHHEKVKRRSRELVEGKDWGNKEGGKGQNKPTEGNTSAVRAGSSDHSSTVAEDSRSSSISSPQSPDQPCMVDQCETSSSSQQNASTAESKFDRTLSPSSGYSSQSGTPTLSQKEICPPTPEKQKTKPPKPERSGSRTSPSVSNSSSVACLSTGESDPVRRGSTPNTTPPQTLKAPPPTAPPHSAVNLRDLLNIPPPPKVKAPSPPPPETWAHNTRTFELLCGPPPDARRLSQLQNQVQGVVHQTQSQEPPLQHHTAASCPKTPASGGDKNVSQVENQGSEKLKVKEEQVPVQTPIDRTTESAFEPLALGNADAVVALMRQRESQDMAVHVKQRDSQDVHQREEACLQADKQKIPEMSNTGKGPTVPKKEPPPVMKKSVRIKQGQRPEEALQSIQGHTISLQSTQGHTNIVSGEMPEVCPSPDTHLSLAKDTTSMVKAVTGGANTERLAPVEECVESAKLHSSSVQAVTGDVNAERLAPVGECVESARLNGSSPPPSPPPNHHPPPPPSKTSPPASSSSPPPEEEQEPLHTESVWPPPPPPLEDLPELVYEGQEELDFPPPPPPFSQQTLPELEGSQIEANQENELEDLEASVGDKCVELPSVQQNEELHPEEEILGNPVAALPTLPEAGKLKQTTMLTADQAVTDVQPGEHLPECFEAMGPLDLGSGTAPSNQFPQMLTEQPALTPENQLLTQELPPLTQEIPPATQEIPPMTQEIPPATQEIPPLTQEIPPPAQETLILTPEILPLVEDLPSLMQETLLLKQLIPTLIQELPPLTLESPTLIEDIPPPPQEAPPPPPSTNDSDPAPEPHRSGSAGLGPSALPLAHVPTSSPPQSSQATVIFRRQSSQLSRESRSKELLLRKSAPMPKEDANIPLVTPSLLQMVRLRSVGVGEDPGMAPSPDHTPKADSPQSQDQDQTIPQKPTSSDQDVSQTLMSLDQTVSQKPTGSDQAVPQKPTGSDQAVPQKPIRKSLSLRAGTPAVKTPGGPAAAPSLRLQEAIRLKTAAMTSRDGLPARLCLRSSMASLHSGDTPSPPGGDMHKSPASTASFIFSKSSKKVVIETASAPEALTGLKQSLAAELRQVSDEAKQVAANGTNKMAKLPPPVARKPPQHSTNATEKVTVTAATERSPWGGTQGSAAGAVAANGGTTMLEVASQQAQATDETDSAGGADRTNSIEVS